MRTRSLVPVVGAVVGLVFDAGSAAGADPAAHAGGAPPTAPGVTVGELAAACRAPERSTQRSWCLSYVRGVLDAERAYVPPARRLTCVPKGTTPEQLRGVVEAWLANEVDQDAEEPAADHVASALTAQYPCQILPQSPEAVIR